MSDSFEGETAAFLAAEQRAQESNLEQSMRNAAVADRMRAAGLVYLPEELQLVTEGVNQATDATPIQAALFWLTQQRYYYPDDLGYRKFELVRDNQLDIDDRLTNFIVTATDEQFLAAFEEDGDGDPDEQDEQPDEEEMRLLKLSLHSRLSALTYDNDAVVSSVAARIWMADIKLSMIKGADIYIGDPYEVVAAELKKNLQAELIVTYPHVDGLSEVVHSLMPVGDSLDIMTQAEALERAAEIKVRKDQNLKEFYNILSSQPEPIRGIFEVTELDPPEIADRKNSLKGALMVSLGMRSKGVREPFKPDLYAKATALGLESDALDKLIEQLVAIHWVA